MTTYDDPLLGPPLPRDDPADTAPLAGHLRLLADRLGVQGARVAAMVGVGRWSGVASAAADRRLGGCGLVLRLEQARLRQAADAVETFSRQVRLSRDAADDARRLVAAARAAQTRADLLDPAAARSRDAGALGRRPDGSLYAPDAVGLLDRARARAVEACTTYDRAAAELTTALTSLSGRRVLRQHVDGRLALDLVALVPGIGSAVVAGDVLHYAATGQWEQVAVTAASAVPGPVGWAVTGAGLAGSISRLGDVTGIERTSPTIPVVPVRAGEPAPAPGRRRRRSPRTSPQPP